MRIARLFASLSTLGFVGYLPKAPGTWGSLVGFLFGLLLFRYVAFTSVFFLFPISILVATFIICVLVCTQAAKYFKKEDPQCVVLDEAWCTFWISIFFGANALLAWVGLVLFRVFDIWKPFPIRQLESRFNAQFGNGFGIMADDAMAMVYTVAILYGLQKYIG